MIVIHGPFIYGEHGGSHSLALRACYKAPAHGGPYYPDPRMRAFSAANSSSVNAPESRSPARRSISPARGSAPAAAQGPPAVATRGPRIRSAIPVRRRSASRG
jgi:hypothetical protein